MQPTLTAASPTIEKGIGTSDRISEQTKRYEDLSGANSPINFKKEPFLLQIEIPDIDRLIEYSNSFGFSS